MEIKEAVAKAKQEVCEMFATGTLGNVRLEEVARGEDGPYWDITVSIPSSRAFLAETLGFDPNRDYKIVRINQRTGDVLQIKIREFGQV